jgi:hypothetical protein
MKLTIRIEMGNAAFEDAGELGRILHELADKVAAGAVHDEGKIRDANGNTVGEWSVE